MGARMFLIVLGEILMGVLAYRRAKADGTLPDPVVKSQDRAPYEPKPLPPNATRLEKIAHWLGLEEDED